MTHTPDADPHAHRNADAQPDADPHAHHDTHTHPDPDPHAHRSPHAHTHPDPDPDADPHAHRSPHAHAHPDADPHAHRSPYAHAHGDFTADGQQVGFHAVHHEEPGAAGAASGAGAAAEPAIPSRSLAGGWVLAAGPCPAGDRDRLCPSDSRPRGSGGPRTYRRGQPRPAPDGACRTGHAPRRAGNRRQRGHGGNAQGHAGGRRNIDDCPVRH